MAMVRERITFLEEVAVAEKPIASLEEYFGRVTDPRVERTKEHQLIDILVIALCGIICGAESWTDIELFGNSKLDWLSTFLELPNGIPSHDTFGRVFSMIDAEEFRRRSCHFASSVP
jgi:DDE_Tnp_1-associated